MKKFQKENTVIKSVEKGSIADEAGICPGDAVLCIDNKRIKDIFDFRYYTAEENITVLIEKPDNSRLLVEIEKDQYDALGIEFEKPLADEQRSCKNKCIFCFIDQLPKGMRKTLYYKDDDVRLSFLDGNYVTLTNIDDKELDRIIRYRMSPVNISVHSVNPILRKKMMNNKNAGLILEKIKKLAGNNILINCQIVVCRGINDEDELVLSINELAKLYPNVKSISVVPSGLTKHRKNLYPLIPHDKESADKIISIINKLQKIFYKKYNSRIVYAADEFYILSNKTLPSYETYEDFYQLENGVGLMRLFINDFNAALKDTVYNGNKMEIISIATGLSAFKYISGMAEKIEKKFCNIKINVFGIKNDFFGSNITVTGLLAGKDIIAQLKGKGLGDRLLLSVSMFKKDEEVLLDDISRHDIEKELAVKVLMVDNTGRGLLNAVLGVSSQIKKQ